MPKDLNGWLKDVIEHSLRRNKVVTKRDRRIFPFIEYIKKKKESGFNPIIAEYKRKSPSGFQSDRDLFQYLNFLKDYVAGFSVLTEEKYFNGSYELLAKVTQIVELPVLMKDFVVSETQIESAYNLGADSVLLIVSIMTEKELERLIEFSRSHNMEPLVEVHKEDELELALRLGAKIIGVNSRNLFTLNVDLGVTEKLLRAMPRNVIKIAESGIKRKEDILKLSIADAFLIGTSLMEQPSKIFEFIKL